MPDDIPPPDELPPPPSTTPEMPTIPRGMAQKAVAEAFLDVFKSLARLDAVVTAIARALDNDD